MATETVTNLIPQGEIANAASDETIEAYVKKRYDDAIGYYWRAAATNKRTYKLNRSLIIILGAGVTLLSSLLSASFLQDTWWSTAISIATPLSAAVLTMINGFIQSFQSGAAWRDMVLSAERLEKERDRFLATPLRDKNYKRELSILNSIVVNESTAFFKRILDSEYQYDSDDDDKR